MQERVLAADVDYLSHYMDEFYGGLTTENEEIGRFLFERQHAREGLKALDVACGPSALYWALFNPPTVAEFHGLDARQASLDYVRGLVDGIALGEIEQRYLEIARWHGKTDERGHVQDIARRFASLRAHDIAQPWPYENDSFDVVASCFGMDHVESQEEFANVLKEAARVLAPGGSLVLVTLCETDSWRCGETIGACLYTTKESLAAALSRAGFSTVLLEERSASTAVEHDQGYEKMLFCHGVKI